MATLTRKEMEEIINNGGSVMLHIPTQRFNSLTNDYEQATENRIVTRVEDLPEAPAAAEPAASS